MIANQILYLNSRKIERNIEKLSKTHNSRTNLINDRDVYVEDVGEDEHYDRVDGEKKNIRYHHIHHHHHTDGHRSEMAVPIPVDDDSMRRHELERGSDIEFERRGSLKRQPAAHDEDPVNDRDQLFIKDGNAEILRLITRGKKEDENIYVNVPQMANGPAIQRPQAHVVPQYIMVDNGGKEILMRRYIEEQSNGKHVIREHYQVVPGPTYIQSIPNEVQHLHADNYVRKSEPNSQIGTQFEEVNLPVDAQMVNAQSHHSLIQQELENSLKQQNALLRQILLEKEKLEEQRYQQTENVMETQSLPGHSFAIATQTDCEAGTQTDPVEVQKPLKRRSRSDNDYSDSEDNYEYIRYTPPNSPSGVYWIKRRKSRSRRGRHQEKIKRTVMVEAVKRKIRTPIQEECEDSRGLSPIKDKQVRKSNRKSRTKSESPLSKKILVEISDSLDEQIIPNIQKKKKYFTRTYLTAEPSGHSVRSKKKEQHQRDEEDESSSNEIILKHYSADSLDEKSDIEEDQIQVTKRSEPNRNFVEEETPPIDPMEALDQITEILAKSGPAPRSDNPRPSAFSEAGRMSRRDGHEASSRNRRQTASEPPQARGSNKAITSRAQSEEKKGRGQKKMAQSESELLTRFHEDVVDVSKTVPKYMEWYYNKNKDTGDSTRADKMRAKAAASAALIKKGGLGVLSQGSEPKRSKKASPMPPKSDKAVDERPKPEPLPRRTTPPKEARLLKEDIQMAKNIDQRNQPLDEGQHSLLQHSEHRFESDYKKAPAIPQPPSKLPHYMYPETPPHVNRETKMNVVQQLRAAQSPIIEDEEKHSKSKPTNITDQKQLNASTLEDDHDSGIGNSLLHSMGRRNPILEKKSVFTIAYDEVKVNKLRSESEGSPIS